MIALFALVEVNGIKVFDDNSNTAIHTADLCLFRVFLLFTFVSDGENVEHWLHLRPRAVRGCVLVDHFLMDCFYFVSSNENTELILSASGQLFSFCLCFPFLFCVNRFGFCSVKGN